MVKDTTTKILNQIRCFDSATANHCMTTAVYTRRFMEFLNFSKEDISKGFNAALIHDAGKMGVSIQLLHKEEKLTDDERAAISAHTKNTADYMPGASEFEIYVAEHHHDPYDQIDMVTQIIAICDVYSALREKRSYKDAYTSVEAIAIMKNNKRKNNLNIMLVYAFEKMLMQCNLLCA